MSRPGTGGRRRRAPIATLVVAIVCAIALSGIVGIRAVAAGTAETMESSILAWLNGARAARGQPALVVGAGLTDLAGDRAYSMAAAGVMSHDVAGCLSCQLSARGIVSHTSGEAIAGTSYPWGSQAANSLMNALSGSPEHMAILMSATFDQVGVGVAYRSANRNTYLSIVVIDGDPLPKSSPPKTSTPPRTTSARTVSAVIRPVAPNLDRRQALLGWLLGFAGDEPRIGNHVYRLMVPL